MRTRFLPLLFLPFSLASCGSCGVAELKDFTRTSAGDGAVDCGSVALDDAEGLAEAHACMSAQINAGAAGYALVSEADQTVAWVVRTDGSGLKLIYTEGSGSIDIGRCPTVVTTPRTTTKPGSGGALSKCNADAPQQQVVSVCN